MGFGWWDMCDDMSAFSADIWECDTTGLHSGHGHGVLDCTIMLRGMSYTTNSMGRRDGERIIGHYVGLGFPCRAFVV